jgi:hypothetical protein
MTSCSDGVFHLRARFVNVGNAAAPSGIRVSFYTGNPAGSHELLGTVPTEEPIPPGFTDVWVSYDFRLTEFKERYDLYVTIDDDGSGEGLIEEVDEENNTAFLLDIGCSVIF